MAMHHHQALCELQPTGMVVESRVRGFRIIADEPVNHGGTDMGMNPVEMLLCALGSCQCITARFFANKLGIELQEYRLELESDNDPKGFIRGQEASGIRPGLQEIRMKVHVRAAASREKIEELLAIVENRCPVGDSVFHGVPVTISHEIAGTDPA